MNRPFLRAAALTAAGLVSLAASSALFAQVGDEPAEQFCVGHTCLPLPQLDQPAPPGWLVVWSATPEVGRGLGPEPGEWCEPCKPCSNLVWGIFVPPVPAAQGSVTYRGVTVPAVAVRANLIEKCNADGAGSRITFRTVVPGLFPPIFEGTKDLKCPCQ